MENTRHDKLKKLVLISLFGALAYVCMLVFRIKVQHLTFDAKDAITTVGAMILGPIPGVIISFLVAFLELIVSDTGIYGFIMNFLSSATFSFVVSFIYRRRKSLNMAFISLASAIIVLVSVMIAANLCITPFYLMAVGMPGADTWQGAFDIVTASIVPLVLPFNFTKALFNSSLILIIYKPISTALYRAKIIKGNDSFKYNKSSIFVLILGVLMLIAAILLFLLLKGSFEWFG